MNGSLGVFFVLLVVAGGVGAKMIVSCVLAVAIVLTYGAVLVLLRRVLDDRTIATVIWSVIGAVLAIPLCGRLISLWGATNGRPFLWSLATWMCIIASGALWSAAARWLQENQDTPLPLQPDARE